MSTTIADVIDATRAHNAAFAEFKSRHDNALSTIERRMAEREIVDAKFRRIDDELDKVVSKLASLKDLKERQEQIEVEMKRPSFGSSGEEKEMTPEHKAFDSFVRRGDGHLDETERKALTVGSDTEGGYLAPPAMSSELVKRITEISPIREISTVRTASAPALLLPRVLTNPSAAWVGEIEASPESQPTFGQSEIPAHRMAAYAEVSQALLEDAAFDIEGELKELFAEQFAHAENAAFINGDGAGKPRGFLTYPAGTADGQVEQFPSGDATGLTADAVIAMSYSLKPSYRARATWVASTGTLSAIRRLKDANDRYLWDQLNGGVVAGQPPTILGYPVVEAVDMPNMAPGALALAFGAFKSAYRVYDRISLRIIRDQFTKARNAIVCFHGYRRVGGSLASFEALKLMRIAVS